MPANFLRKLRDAAALRIANASLRPFRTAVPGDDPYHHLFTRFRGMVASAGSPSVLEIGSRNVSNVHGKSLFPGVFDYTGVDIHPGENVDVVADAHRLSEFFPEKRFDFVYSMSVFEHLAFPWKIALEINAVLKPGGHVFASTHPVWPAHELPWDFWRFMENSMHCLFNKATGFEIVGLTEGLPGRVFSHVGDPALRRNYQHIINQGIAVIARKIGDYDRDRLRWDLAPTDIMESLYPVNPVLKL